MSFHNTVDPITEKDNKKVDNIRCCNFVRKVFEDIFSLLIKYPTNQKDLSSQNSDENAIPVFFETDFNGGALQKSNHFTKQDLFNRGNDRNNHASYSGNSHSIFNSASMHTATERDTSYRKNY